MPHNQLQDELKEVCRIARGAGAILRKYYAKTMTVEWKAPGDPVTIADLEASDYIVGELQKLFPKDGVLSEEMADAPSHVDRSRVWMVDPMDGTREFIDGREDFAVMIGLVIDGIPRLGAVYQPSRDKMFFASHGSGATLEDGAEVHPLHVSPERVASHMTLAMSRSHRSARVDLIADQLRIQRVIRIGSVGLKVGLIAEGGAHLYIHLGNQTKVWDTCAPEAILFEAGGNLTDIAGNRLDYRRHDVRNPNGIIATNGVIHSRAVQVALQVINGSPGLTSKE